MAMDSRMSTRKTVRSSEFPSSRVWTCATVAPPSHCAGSRDATINIQTRGTHSATETRESLAGSKINSSKRSTAHEPSAIEGGIGLSLLAATRDSPSLSSVRHRSNTGAIRFIERRVNVIWAIACADRA